MNPAIFLQPESALEFGVTAAPERLLSLKRVARDLGKGRVMLLVVEPGCAQDEVIAWARTTGREVLGVEEFKNGRRGYRIQNGDPWPVRAVLDMRGTRCPVPVIEAARRLRTIAPGDVLKLLSDCPGAPADVAAWSRTTKREILATVRDSRGGYRFYIRKSP